MIILNDLRQAFTSGDQFTGSGKVIAWIISRLLIEGSTSFAFLQLPTASDACFDHFVDTTEMVDTLV